MVEAALRHLREQGINKSVGPYVVAAFLAGAALPVAGCRHADSIIS